MHAPRLWPLQPLGHAVAAVVAEAKSPAAPSELSSPLPARGGGTVGVAAGSEQSGPP